MSLTAQNKRALEQERRGAIMASAKRLFLTGGFEGTSMEAIAADAGVSKGLIYHYFKDKGDLLLSFSGEVEAYLESLSAAEDPLGALRRFGCDFLANDEEHFKGAPPIQTLLIAFAEEQVDPVRYGTQNPILQDVGRGFLAGLFQRGMDEGVLRRGDARVYGDLYWSYLLGKLLTVKKGRESLAPEAYVEEALGVLMKS